jgi:serine phosphatase RsbU (regulator of sigma subunit)
VSRGGHPLHLLIRPPARAVTFGQTRSLVGILEEARFVDTTVTLGTGDVIVLYADGVTEARDQRDDFTVKTASRRS